MPATPPSLPPIPQPSKDVLNWAKRLAEWLKRSRPVAGTGLKGQQTSGGYILSAVPSESGSDWDHPFKISTAGTSGQIAVSVRAGKVYGNGQESKYLESTGTESVITLAASGTHILQLEMVSTRTAGTSGMLSWSLGTAAVSSVSAIGTDSGYLPNDTEAARYLTIGSAITNGSSVETIVQDLEGDAWDVFNEASLPVSAEGDIFYSTGSSVAVLAAGTTGDVLVMGATVPEWETPSDCA